MAGREFATGVMECVEGDLLKRVYERYPKNPEYGFRKGMLEQDLCQCLNETNAIDWFYWGMFAMISEDDGTFARQVGCELAESMLSGVPKVRIKGVFEMTQEDLVHVRVLSHKDREVVLRCFEGLANGPADWTVYYAAVLYKAGETNSLNKKAMEWLGQNVRHIGSPYRREKE